MGRGFVTVGERTFKGGGLSCLFIRPRPGSSIASVGVVAGTGIVGMRLNCKMAYMMPGIGFPDCLVSDAEVLYQGERAVRAAGFFGIDWSVERGEFIWQAD